MRPKHPPRPHRFEGGAAPIPRQSYKVSLMRTIILALALLFSLIAPAQATPPRSFLLLYSNNVHGETEPCG